MFKCFSCVFCHGHWLCACWGCNGFSCFLKHWFGGRFFYDFCRMLHLLRDVDFWPWFVRNWLAQAEAMQWFGWVQHQEVIQEFQRPQGL
eukprot:Skav202115  [mRNA]  locus=scaffold1980:128330:128596:- [translate_table: standard]